MPTLEYFLVAESIAVDQTTSRISVFNIVDDLEVTTFSATIPQMAAVCSWNLLQGDAGQEFQARLRIEMPDAEPREQRVNFTGQQQKHHRLIWRLIGLPVAAEGTVRLEVELNGEHQASHTIAVKHVPETAAAPAST